MSTAKADEGARTQSTIVHTTQIECGKGEVIAAGERRFRILPAKETLETDAELLVGGYNVCVQFSNPSFIPTQIEIDLDLENWFEEDWCRLPFRLPFWRRRAGSREWTEADRGQRNSRHGVHLTLDLAAEETVVLSTIPHFTYTDCTRELRALAKQLPESCHVVEIGRSGESRALLAFEAGTSNASRRIVILGSTRPSEPAAWGILAMAKALIRDESLRSHLEQFRICLIPQPNPDGIVQGRCFGNGSGIPITGDWANPLESNIPETVAIWNYLQIEPPALIGQFEFAPVTTRLTDWPRPLSLDMYNPASVALYDRLIALSGESGLFLKDRRSPAGLQLSHYAARKWGCAAFAYRYVGAVTTPVRAEARAVQVLKAVLETLRCP